MYLMNNYGKENIYIFILFFGLTNSDLKTVNFKDIYLKLGKHFKEVIYWREWIKIFQKILKFSFQ